LPPILSTKIGTTRTEAARLWNELQETILTPLLIACFEPASPPELLAYNKQEERIRGIIGRETLMILTPQEHSEINTWLPLFVI
jgi:hypothetical protein